jgi:hypothetical protein
MWAPKVKPIDTESPPITLRFGGMQNLRRNDWTAKGNRG